MRIVLHLCSPGLISAHAATFGAPSMRGCISTVWFTPRSRHGDHCDHCQLNTPMVARAAVEARDHHLENVCVFVKTTWREPVAAMRAFMISM